MLLPRVVWTWPGATTLLILVMVIIFWPLMPVLEGWAFPVTGKISFVDVVQTDGGLSARMKFNKFRDCEFLGVSADRDDVPIAMDPIHGGFPITLPTGQRLSRPWLIGTDSLEGIRVRWVHRCSPYWTTITMGYP